jgi:large subunit ribosomal protein L6
MSRIGRKPVVIPKGVTLNHDEAKRLIVAKGPKGTNELIYHKNMSIKIDGDTLTVSRPNDQKENRALHGLTRKLIDNLVVGVSTGFEKRLLINGVGYKAEAKGDKLVLYVGYSHPVDMPMPKDITAKVEKNLIILSGIDRQKLGQFAAEVRKVRPPEPYKGAGIRYHDEHIRRKAGKKAA